MSFDMAVSRQLRDEIQQITERVASLVGSDHAAVSALMRAADELAAAALSDEPGDYGDRPEHG